MSGRLFKIILEIPTYKILSKRNGEIGNVQNAVKLAEADSNFVNEHVLVETQAIPAVQAQTMSSDPATAKHAQVILI